MLYNLFLRDEGDPSADPKDPKDPKDPELGKQDPKPQDDPKPDPDPKPGLSDEEKAELETLRKENETLGTRLKDTQTEFHDNREELKVLRKRVDDFSRPPIKAEDEFADDAQIQKINRKIAAYNEREYDTAPLDELKAARIREIKLEKRVERMEARGAESDEIGDLLIEEPSIKDFKPVGETRKKLTDRGEKVSMDTAHYYNLGKSRKADFDSAVKAEVEKRLEVEKKGNEARGQEGVFDEPAPDSAEKKEEQEYANFLTDPGGIGLE